MKRNSLILAAAIAFMTLAGYTARAGIQEPKPLSGWEHAAFKAFQDDDYPKAMKALDGHKSDRFAKVLSAFVHHQQFVFTKSKTEKVIWEGEYHSLAVSVGVDDIPYLSLIAQEKDKPKSSKYAKKLLERCFTNINDNKDVPALVYYLGVPDQDINSYAMKCLERILKSRRNVVKDGGSLRNEDVNMMKDKTLISQLVAIVAQQDVGKIKAAYPKGVGRAVDCLVFIEEPALESLDTVATVNTAKAKEKILKAINGRKKKFPQSNWYSATGKARG